DADWARFVIRNCKQGSSRTNDFLHKFISLKDQGNVLDDYATALLEKAIQPKIL
ncbi:hypothetical protein J3A83DRAFT_4093211, partial [Scleroderma citrinum]